jgi:hypothetical protein
MPNNTIKFRKKSASSVMKAAIAALGISLFSAPATMAGSVGSSDTWAADVNSIALPAGTFIVLDYTGYHHESEFVSPNGTVYKDTHADLFTDISRIVYFAGPVLGHPLVLEAALPYAGWDNAKSGYAMSHGLSDGTTTTFFSPVLFADYGLIVDPRNQRFLALTNYIYLPTGNYDKTKFFNPATPGQTVDVPQFSYAEGLAKFSPALQNFWIDVIGNVSFHSDGHDPLSANSEGDPGHGLGLQPGVANYSKLTQDNSYNLKGFLRYNWNPALWVAAGVERSWGGTATATGGTFTFSPSPIPGLGGQSGPAPSQVLSKDDYVKGHLQISVPLSKEFHVATDLTHDFYREGGLKEDFTAELRLTNLFLPQEPLK